MIVTLTINPSLDRTGQLRTPLARGVMHRLVEVGIEPGGKGVNVARCVQLAGRPTLAVLPAAPREPILTLLEVRGLPFSAVDVASSVRANLSIREPDGTVTKLNEPGGEIFPQETNSVREALLVAAERAEWVVLAGSLPPGVPVDFYVDMVRALRQFPVKVALDTSDAPLRTAARAWPLAAPDLFTPNMTELAQACGLGLRAMRSAAEAGDVGPVVEAARSLVERGVGAVLVTLGPAGAVLVNDAGAWAARPPEVATPCRMGAGDATNAGYLLAEAEGASAADCLRNAVAYGAAAAQLDGPAVPTPQQADPTAVQVEAL